MLSLDDVDWRAGEIIVRGKGNRCERLPLPVEVGDAVAGYLRRGRRGTAEGRSVFVRVKAPHWALSTGGVTQVVFAAGGRAGREALRTPVAAHRGHRGLHAGIDTSTVALWLGHAGTKATQIYLHADLALQEAALARTAPTPAGRARYHPPDDLLTFLESL